MLTRPCGSRRCRTATTRRFCFGLQLPHRATLQFEQALQVLQAALKLPEARIGFIKRRSARGKFFLKRLKPGQGATVSGLGILGDLYLIATAFCHRRLFHLRNDRASTLLPGLASGHRGPRGCGTGQTTTIRLEVGGLGPHFAACLASIDRANALGRRYLEHRPGT